MNCEDCDIYVCETTACVTVDKYEARALAPAAPQPSLSPDVPTAASSSLRPKAPCLFATVRTAAWLSPASSAPPCNRSFRYGKLVVNDALAQVPRA
jgi:hypothetical protein